MQDENQVNSEVQNDDIVIDLGSMFEDYVSCVRRWWFQFSLLTLTFLALAIVWYNYNYMPSYEAKVTYSVNKTGDTSTDTAIGVRLSGAVATLTAESEFREDLMRTVDSATKTGSYSFTSAYTESVNLFSVTVASNNYENSNLLLALFMDIYPDWASRSVGTVELQIVDRAYAGETPANAYSPYKTALIGLVLGLAVCFVFATIYVFTINTVRKESDMKKVTTKSCLSLIPEVQEKKRSEKGKISLLINNKHIDWGLRQSILAAQSRIEKLMEQENQQVLMITSTLPKEGKSMISVNLALAFAEKGKKVVLIDGDLRNPSVMRALGLEDRPGLLEYMRDHEAIHLVKSGGIRIIPGGKDKGNASSLLNDRKMQPLIAHLRAQYDYIIIDTPPAYTFSDAEILSKYADAVLYIVCHDTPTVREVREAITPYIQSKKLAGYLINRNPGGYSTYGKYGKYGRYGRYGGYGGYGGYRGYSKGHYGQYEKYIHPKGEGMNTEESL